MNARFPRELKLTKTDEFSSVFSFRKRIASPTLVFHYQPNQFGYARMGLVVSKKSPAYRPIEIICGAY